MRRAAKARTIAARRHVSAKTKLMGPQEAIIAYTDNNKAHGVLASFWH
jgi:hypothetical protein